MNGTELQSAIAKKTGVRSDDVAAVLQAVSAIALEKLMADERVILPGLGILKTKVRAQKLARNPRTGEPAIAPARRVVKFQPSPDLKAHVK